MNVKEILDYTTNYTDPASQAIADDGVRVFLDKNSEWKEVVGLIIGGKDGEEIYGNALLVCSGCLYDSSLLSESYIQVLCQAVQEYEPKAKYKLGIGYSVFLNLGLCWHKLGAAFDDRAVEMFKKYIFYSLAMSNHTAYRPVGYSFRRISDYLFDSLEKGEINLSAPATFNDVYDCPILELLRTKGDDVSHLINKAYRYTVKVACFVSNTMLPSLKQIDPKSGMPARVLKPEGNTPEYLKDLMWGYYADGHQGVCLEYHFGHEMSHFPGEGQFRIAYFRDVRYSDELYDYADKDSIDMNNAFFLKSKKWEKENELRYLSFDIDGDSDYQQVPAANMLSAVYFGAKISKENQDKVMTILEGKKWVEKDLCGKETWHEIEFYKIEADETAFGKLKAVRIK